MDNKTTKPVLKSKVAQRLFFLFTLCSLLPLTVISVVSLIYVGSQLENDAAKRLHQQCKNKGMLIFERLATLDNELKYLAKQHKLIEIKDLVKKPFDPFEREGSGWRRISLVDKDQQIVTLVNNTDDLPLISLETIPKVQKDNTVLKVIENREHKQIVTLFRRVDPASDQSSVIIGEINPLYLWGIGATGSLPPEIDLTVILPPKKVMISSIVDNTVPDEFLNSYTTRSFSGSFESTLEGKSYINSYWSLFLKHRFSCPNWTIIFSQTKASVMLPVSNFVHIFFLLVLLTFWIIVMLSIRTIRRRTVPIDQLKKAAQKIANGELGYQVNISSGDEYETLAATFNEMSSNLKQSQAILLQTTKMSTFGQMSAGIIHEIGQPLTAIKGYAELLRMKLPQEKQEKYIATINREVERLFHIIDKFRTFSRVSETIFRPVRLKEIFTRTMDLMEHQLQMNNITVDLSQEENLPAIYGDANALQQVILNLLTNAMDALETTPKAERRVTVSVSTQSDKVHVDIGDNGSGIPEEVRASIFDPFFTTKGEDKGTGLGLSIISSILHKHGATIECKSVVGKGTTFYITLPAHQGGGKEAEPASEHGTPAPPQPV